MNVIRLEGSGESSDARTRQQVRDLVVEKGPVTASTIARILGLTTAAVRRHLTILLSDNEIAEHEPGQVGRRGRGRPARHYVATARAHEKLLKVTRTLPLKPSDTLGRLAGEKRLILLLQLALEKSKDAMRLQSVRLVATRGCEHKHSQMHSLLMGTQQRFAILVAAGMLSSSARGIARLGRLLATSHSCVRLRLLRFRDCSMFTFNDLQHLRVGNTCAQPIFRFLHL